MNRNEQDDKRHMFPQPLAQDPQNAAMNPYKSATHVAFWSNSPPKISEPEWSSIFSNI